LEFSPTGAMISDNMTKTPVESAFLGHWRRDY